MPMSTENLYNLAERLGELLRVERRGMLRAKQLEPVHLATLRYLCACNRFSNSASAITEYLGQTKGTTSQTLKVLEKKSLLKRVADVKDRRVVHFLVTSKGRQLVSEVAPSLALMDACARIEPSDQVGAEQVLAHLITALLQTNNMRAFGACGRCRHNQRRRTGLTEGGSFCNLVKQELSASDNQLICREYQRVDVAAG